MKTDIRETDDAKAYRFAVELPGFKKDEISLDIKDGYLTIAAQKGVDKDEQDKKGRVPVSYTHLGGDLPGFDHFYDLLPAGTIKICS